MFIQAEIIGIQKKIKEKENIIASSKSEHLISVRELNAVFADKYLSNYNWDHYGDNKLSNFILSVRILISQPSCLLILSI